MRQSLQRALGGSRSWHNWRRTADGSRKTGAFGSRAVRWLVPAAEEEAALPLLLTVSERSARGNPGLDGILLFEVLRSERATRSVCLWAEPGCWASSRQLRLLTWRPSRSKVNAQCRSKRRALQTWEKWTSWVSRPTILHPALSSSIPRQSGDPPSWK